MRRLGTVALAWALCAGATEVADAQVVRGDPPSFMVGHFVDDYGIRYSITPDSWTQGREARYSVVAWDQAARQVLVRSSVATAAGSDLWTRIDWVELDGPDGEYPWAFCYGAYDQGGREAAQSAPASERRSPRTGCNGFPFSRMKRTDNSAADAGPAGLRITTVGNAGVVVSDEATSLLAQGTSFTLSARIP